MKTETKLGILMVALILGSIILVCSIEQWDGGSGMVTEKEAEENLPIGEQHKISAYLMTILPIYAL